MSSRSPPEHTGTVQPEVEKWPPATTPTHLQSTTCLSVGHDPADAYDEAQLRSSLDQLATLVLGSGQDGLERLLTHVAHFAVRAIPGADGAGLTLLEHDRADTIVASAEFVREVDAIQYSIGEGPCITAAATGRTMHSRSLGTDAKWPTFGPQVSRLGVHSALSLPLIAAERVLGAMNVYSRSPDAFDDHAIELGEMFAVPATISVQNAQILAEAARLASKLQSALTARASVEQALGILIGRTGCSANEALERLRQLSQSENRKVADTARTLVDEAGRRARARSGDNGRPPSAM